MTFYILHPYRRASTRNNTSKFTIVLCIQCYVSVITEKYDLSFQFTYHTLVFDFQTTCGRTCSIQHVKDTTDSVTRSTYFKYINFSTTYLEIISFQRLSLQREYREILKYGQVHREYPSSGENSRWVNARLRLLQFTHPAHPNGSFRLSYLLRQFL